MRFSISAGIILTLFQMLNCQLATPAKRLSFFDVELLQVSSMKNKPGNVMISPASIKSTLAMLLEGARGETAAEIKRALRVAPDRQDFRHDLKVFLKAFEANSTSITLENANALFTSTNVKLMKKYEELVRGIYLSEIVKVNFNDVVTSARTVNTWAANKTHGLIPTIIEEDQISPSTELMLTNALYFKAAWKYSFNIRMTHKDCFYVKGVCRDIAMMVIQDELKYAYVEDLRSHAIELPYEDDRFSMLLLVPKDRDVGYSALLHDLPYFGILDLYKLMQPNDVVLQMPKFDLEYKDDMTEHLRNLGIKSLFSSTANLSGIFEGGEFAQVSSIQHSVRMKVDEVGTIAAAVSTSVVVPLINDQIRIRLDRPFLFFIRDNKLGVTLFEGKIEEPTAYVESSTPKAKPQVHKRTTEKPFVSDITQQQASGQASFNQAGQNNPTNNQAVQNNPTNNQTVQNNPTIINQAVQNNPTINQADPTWFANDPASSDQSSFIQQDTIQPAVPVNNKVHDHVTAHREQTRPDLISLAPTTQKTYEKEIYDNGQVWRYDIFAQISPDNFCPSC